MNFQGSKFVSSLSSPSMEDDMINSLLLSHDPVGRHFDSMTLLRVTKNIMFHATEIQENHYFGDAEDIGQIEMIGSEEPIKCGIYKLLSQMYRNGEGEDLHKKTMFLFDLLGDHRWEEKVVLALTALAVSYGEFQLLKQLSFVNPLTASISILKQIPRDTTKFKLQFKTLSTVVKSMMDLAECIIKFEGQPFSEVELDYDMKFTAKTHTYIAAYWIMRSCLICNSQIKALMGAKPEKVSYNLTAIATWELSILVIRLSRIYNQLNQQVEICDQMMETKLHQKLINLVEETRAEGNQELLRMLFGLNEEFPLQKHSLEEKLGISELINKVVILLISKPDLPIERILFIVQQITDHPHRESSEGSFEVIWVPISLSDSWTDAEMIHAQLLSKSLPFFSIRHPWLLSASTIKFIKEKWKFEDDLVMGALDSNGRVLNSNALDMVFIWGCRAYPFSVLKEKELWLEQKWTLQLLIDGIDPLLTKWAEEGTIVCIYGSCSLKWIREFNEKMKEIEKEGVTIKIVYVGGPNPDQDSRTISGVVEAEKISRSLSFMKISFFWLRMESIRRSKLRLNTPNDDILEKVLEMVNISKENEDGWAVMGSGSCLDTIKLQGLKQMECLNLFPKWKENVGKLGFLGALRTAIDPPLLSGPCGHSMLVSCVEEADKRCVVCDKCKRVMKKFIVYQ